MRLIKRYSNRKLYDTTTRTYITIEGLIALVLEGFEIKVVENDTDEDITSLILTQMLLEKERTRRSLSSGFLSSLLRNGEQLGRSLSSLARPISPLGTSPAGLLGILEHEIERNLKFWLDLGMGSEEEVLKIMERTIERRRKIRTQRNGLNGKVKTEKFSLSDLDNFENENASPAEPPAEPISPPAKLSDKD